MATDVSSISSSAAPVDFAGDVSERIGGTTSSSSFGEETEIWNEYRCRSLSFGKKHPGKVVEPASLAAVPLPRATYKILDTLKPQADSGALSELQLEAVSYACQQHLRIMANGTRFGFFIGDGTGLGKGRSCASIIIDNFCRKRRKHLWFSTSTDLVKDAKRDFEDLGCHIPVHEGVQMLDRNFKGLGQTKETQIGVVFSTFSSLVSARGKRNRFEQLCDWLGDPGTFQGCIIFDECHKAKNHSDKEGSGSKVAKSVREIQKRFPKARVVYVSATGVTDITNMAYMDRLGLWGEGTAFSSFDDFRTSMGTRNLGALEMLAMELKASGMYVSRGLSFAEAKFEISECELTSEQHEIYRKAAELWLWMREAFKAGAGIAGVGRSMWRPFHSAHQRFFKQICIAFKIPLVVGAAKAAIAAGRCVVIGLQTTGESAVDFWVENRDKRAEGLAVCFVNHLTVEQLVENHFPVFKPRPEEREQPNFESIFNHKVSQLAAIKEEILARLRKLTLPTSTIDDLIFRLGGHEVVAEMTGRATVLAARQNADAVSLADVADEVKALPRHEVASLSGGKRSAGDHSSGHESLNIREKKAFMSGKKLIAIISDAASTGISLHADERAQNTKRRVHITCELPWAADAAIQQLGRTHRSNQTLAPEYKLVTSGIGGENRFISAVAGRLQSLGALTNGDRRASTGMSLADFNFNSQYGRSSLRAVCESAQRAAIAFGDWRKPIELSKRSWELAEAKTVVSSTGTFWDGTQKINNEEEFIRCVRFALALIFNECTVLEAEQLEVISFKEDDTRNVKKFLNKLLGLPVHLQDLIFSYFLCTLEAQINQAKLQGTYDEGIADIHANSMKVKTLETLYTYPATAGKLSMHLMRLDRGIQFKDACKILLQAYGSKGLRQSSNVLENMKQIDEECLGKNVGGFFQSRKELPGGQGIAFIMAVRLGQKEKKFSVFRPNTGRHFEKKSESDLNSVYRRITIEEAREQWNIIFKNTADHCIHGKNCSVGPSCHTGRRISEVAILSGTVVPLWSHLVSILHNVDIPKSETSLRIVRAQLDDGERIVGIRWPVEAIEPLGELLNKLKSNTRDVRIYHGWTGDGCNLGFDLGADLRFKNLSSVAERQGLSSKDHLIAVDGINLETLAAQTALAFISRRLRENQQMTITVREELPDIDRTTKSMEGDNMSTGSVEILEDDEEETPNLVPGSKVTIEPVSPVDPKAYKQAFFKPVTLDSFFKPKRCKK